MMGYHTLFNNLQEIWDWQLPIVSSLEGIIKLLKLIAIERQKPYIVVLCSTDHKLSIIYDILSLIILATLVSRLTLAVHVPMI